MAPQNAVFETEEGQKVGYNTTLFSYQGTSVLESVPLSSKIKNIVLNGELVGRGDKIAVRRKSFLGKKYVTSSVCGVAKIFSDRIEIQAPRAKKSEKAGVVGTIKSIDRSENAIDIKVRGTAIAPLYVSKLGESFSGVLEVDQGAEILFISKEQIDGYLGRVSERATRHVIFEAVDLSQFKQINKVLLDKRISFSVLEFDENVTSRAGLEIRKSIGKRIFVNQNYLFCSFWREKHSGRWFTKPKKEERIYMFRFNKPPISCKLSELKNRLIKISTDSGEDQNYLNIIKK